MPHEDQPHPARPALSLGAFYFFAFAALGALFPFLPLLLASRGFGADRISWVMVLSPASNLLAPPAWGILADLSRARVRLLRLAAVGAGLSLLFWLPRWGLWGALGAMALHCFFRAPITPLADAIAHAMLVGQRERFARIRVWGSVGFAAAVATMGGLNASSRPVLLLLSTGALLLCAAGVTARLRPPEIPRTKVRLRMAVRHLRHPSTAVFMLATGCYYAGHATYDAYYSLYLRQELGLSDAFVGLAWATGVTAEIGLMLIAPRLMRHQSALLVFASLVATGRWWALSTFEQPGQLLALQPLHAITFGLWYLSMVKQVQDQAPEHLRASHQSLAMAVVGLGMVGGYLAGGRVMRARGGRPLFRLAAGSGALAALLYLLALLLPSPAAPDPHADHSSS